MSTSSIEFEQLGVLYLGRPAQDEGLLLYDSRDLVTHAVCVGMTGSGKTGLCISLIEEAALDGVPAIAIDPKGDLTNLLLTFPGLSAAEFRPWINEEDASRTGKTADEWAALEASRWKDGLAAWGQDGARIQRLRDAAEFRILTPGSDAGLAVNVLGSFAPPPATGDAEALAEAVTGTITGLLALVGIDADPLTSREHILLSTILSAAWRGGETLDLAALIGRVQDPGVDKVGVLDLESFFPKDDRFALATRLNNLLAAPGFESWLRGEPLDVDIMLHGPEGRPRISVVSIAHLQDAERMFVVTLLLNAVVSWVRRQSGTSSLRALLYMDELFGFLPPVAEPPSKRPLLTLLKQARAIGLGCVLSTQNPVDLDYKALGNAGTWLIGRLQTDRDRERLLDGLEGAAATREGFGRTEIETTLAGLGKRVFLMNNVHEDGPVSFETRWAMSYLRGPLTRDQIAQLQPAAQTAAQTPAPPAPAPAPRAPAPAAPVIPPGVPTVHLPVRASGNGPVVYLPMLYGAAHVRYANVKAGVDEARELALLLPAGDGPGPVDWDSAEDATVEPEALAAAAERGAEHLPAPAQLLDAKAYAKLGRDLAATIRRTRPLTLMRSDLGPISSPSEDEGAFRARLALSAREQRDAAAEKLRARYAPKIEALQERIRRAEQAVEREKEQVTSAGLGAAISLGATILGSFMGRKKLSTQTVSRAGTVLRGAGRTADQRGDVDRAEDTVQSLRQKLADLEREFTAETAALGTRFDASTAPLERLEIKLKASDVSVRMVALAWAPHSRDTAGGLHRAW